MQRQLLPNRLDDVTVQKMTIVKADCIKVFSFDICGWEGELFSVSSGFEMGDVIVGDVHLKCVLIVVL